jgi:apolipoprotein N-acyltransferase
MRRPLLAILLGATTGVALVCAAPPHRLYPLVFVAFVPLLRAADNRAGARDAAVAGWVAGAAFYFGACEWLPQTIARFQAVGLAAAWSLFALFVAFHALQFSFAAALTGLLGAAGRYGCHQVEARASTAGTGRPAVSGERDVREGESRLHSVVAAYISAASTAAVWVLLEWTFPKVFPWSIGSALGPDPWLRQAAELGGVYGLTLLVMLVNALLASGADRRRPTEQRLAVSLAAGGVIVLALSYGAWRTQHFAARHGEGVEIAIVQGGIPPRIQFDGGPERALEVYAGLSRAAAPAADLLIWPENALPVYLRDNDVFAARLASLLRIAQRPIVLGALDRLDHDGAGRELNTAYLLRPSTPLRPTAIHHKAALLPFGEYVPGARYWPRLRGWRTTGDFVSGAPAALFDVDVGVSHLRVAPSICFEAIHAGAFNALVRHAAGLLVNLTDDGWFASVNAAAQHLELTRLRAVETRRWLVRASNSGISAFIDPSGRVARHCRSVRSACSGTGSKSVGPRLPMCVGATGCSRCALRLRWCR